MPPRPQGLLVHIIHERGTHRLSLSGTIETPRWLGKLRFSPIVRYGSAGRFNLGYGVDRNLNDQSTDRVRYDGDLDDLRWRRPGSGEPTELLSRFSLQPIGSKGGNLPRNAGIGPSLFIFDLGITREWRFGDEQPNRYAVDSMMQEFESEADEWAHLVADNRIAVTELDGRLAHPFGRTDADTWRDNAVLVEREWTPDAGTA